MRISNKIWNFDQFFRSLHYIQSS